MPSRRGTFGLAALLVPAAFAAWWRFADGGRQTTHQDALDPTEATVYLLAAASTSEAVVALTRRFEEVTRVKIKVTTGASNALANQILAGVPSHVFLSASMEWAERIVRGGLAEETRPLLGNRLVMVTPRGNPAGIHRPEDLLSDRLRHIALAGDKVPAGAYAEQALRRAGLYDKLTGLNRVARGQDVRLTLGYVETGEAEAGIVYATDARASNRIDVVYSFPEESHDPITYPLILLRSDKAEDEGRRLFDFLSSPEAMTVFERFGFSSATMKTENP